MSDRRFFRRAAFLLLVIVIAGGALSTLAPEIVYSYLPAPLREASFERITHEIAWRAEFYVEKASGHTKDLSWHEVIAGTWPGRHLGHSWPGSGFITDAMVTEGRSLEASIVNPLDDPGDIAKGKTLFEARCAACHGNDGRGGAHAPVLAKPNYSVGSSDFALYKVLRDGIPGTAMAALDLSIEERWQLIGFLRSLSRHATEGEGIAEKAPAVNVSWEMLKTARSRTDEWLTYSGSLDGWHHSPLTQIATANVSSLKLVWAHQFATTSDDSFEATPIVAGKTIFMTEPPSNVVAIDAETGRQIWHYDFPLPTSLPICCGRVNRGLAILGDTLFLGALDGELVALDAQTGQVRWKTRVADPRDGFTLTAAPLVVKNAVVVGVAGGEFGIRGFLSAFDAQTGKPLWRFETIPGPGEPGHETWGDDSWKTGGGPTWITGSYDPDLNLLYWGVGNPSPDYASGVRPGDNLYSNSVVALDATTGKLVWHFQFTPHDAHDWDSNQTPILADLMIDGVPRKVICWANRNGFYYVLDRTNGAFIRGVPYVPVNWATGLDAKGRPILTKDAEVTTKGTLTQPWVGGGTNWLPPSFDPQTGTFLVHTTQGSSIYTSSAADHVERGQGGLYVGSGTSVGEIAVMVVEALDAATGAIKWKHTSPKQQSAPDLTYSGILSTDGGVLFSAHAGVLFALDTRTGAELWQAGLGGKTQATPITFTLDGKQVVAMTAGRTLFLFGL